jgi:hypothetical protein
MPSQNAPASPGNIQKFKISSNQSDKAIDLSGGVVEFRYYESVLSNNVTATAVVVDSGYESDGGSIRASKGVLNALPIRGGERTDIVIEDNKENKLSFQSLQGLYVNRVRDADPGTSKDVFFVDFASKEFFANEQQRVMKRYEGKISEHVNEILRTLGDNVKIEQVDNTSLNYNFIGSDRKPFYTCTWLASKAVPDKDVGSRAGFLFYQTRDGMNFRSIDKLFEQEPVKKYIFNNTGETSQGNDANVLDYSIDSDIDLKQNLTLGTYNSRAIYFNPFAMDYYVKEFKYKPDNVGKAGKYFAGDLVAKEFTETPTRLMSHVFDVGAMPNGTGNGQLEQWKQNPSSPNYDAENTMAQSVMRYNQMFTVKINVTLEADLSIKAGDVVQCEFPEVSGEQAKDTNPQTGGIYMVASVCHRITPRESFTKLALVRDSFGKKTGFK